MLRKEQQFNQSAFAEELGYARPYLSRVESGKCEPGLQFLRKAAHTLRVPVALLLVGEVMP